MLSIELPKDVEQHLNAVIQKNYQGNIRVAITSFLRLQEKYGWKEQFKEDTTTF